MTLIESIKNLFKICEHDFKESNVIYDDFFIEDGKKYATKTLFYKCSKCKQFYFLTEGIVPAPEENKI